MVTLFCACVQGHFQIVLNNDHCPLFQKDLSWFQRLMYCSGVWAYVVGAITTPMFIIIPLVGHSAYCTRCCETTMLCACSNMVMAQFLQDPVTLRS